MGATPKGDEGSWLRLEELGSDAVTTEAAGNPTQSSGTEMALLGVVLGLYIPPY